MLSYEMILFTVFVLILMISIYSIVVFMERTRESKQIKAIADAIGNCVTNMSIASYDDPTHGTMFYCSCGTHTITLSAIKSHARHSHFVTKFYPAPESEIIPGRSKKILVFRGINMR